jgi:hypothetical protein
MIDMDQANESVRRLLDHSVEASQSLWTAILTANSLAFAAAAFISSPSEVDRWLLFSLLVIVSTSSTLMIWNFRAFQQYYRNHLLEYQRKVAEYLQTGTLDERFDDARAERLGKSLRGRETFALVLSFVVLVLIGLMIIC